MPQDRRKKTSDRHRETELASILFFIFFYLIQSKIFQEQSWSSKHVDLFTALIHGHLADNSDYENNNI